MLRVRDIMQTKVVTVSPELTLRELAQFWTRHGISGAPVCDATGAVLGVVSMTDLVHYASEEPASSGPVGQPDLVLPPEEVVDEGEEASWYYYLAREAPSLYAGALTLLDAETVDELTVRDIMTHMVFHVEPGATVPELARLLLRGKIHRALVMDGEELVGIVTAFDVLRVAAELPELEDARHAS